MTPQEAQRAAQLRAKALEFFEEMTAHLQGIPDPRIQLSLRRSRHAFTKAMKGNVEMLMNFERLAGPEAVHRALRAMLDEVAKPSTVEH